MARRPWRAVLWVGVLTTVLATAGLQFVVRPQLATDPRVGSGRLDAPAVAVPPAPVLPALQARSDAVAPDRLAAVLDALPREGGGDLVGLVVDAQTGTELYRTGTGARTPASSLKVLSTLVATDVLGADHRFATRTLLDADGSLVLKGGGDPLLSSAKPTGYPHTASLEQLAIDTAAALKAQGKASVTLNYDVSLFGGPGWNPNWTEIFRRSVGPITALTADHARIGPGLGSFERDPDPNHFAAQAFATHLRAQGIEVKAVQNKNATASATPLAQVDSLPVGVIAEHVLQTSDNDAAETLLWQASLATGGQANPSGAAAQFKKLLMERGLWADGMNVVDGNGIADANQVTPDALVKAVRMAIEKPNLRMIASGLPVAGVSGTLLERFEAQDAVAARGVVRAKTGTIRGVNTLTGYTVTASGQPVVFAFMVSGGAGQTSARAWLDRATAALASVE